MNLQNVKNNKEQPTLSKAWREVFILAKGPVTLGLTKVDPACLIVTRNKARLVAQGHTQEEGIDYDEVFAHVARIKAIRKFGFTDVKSASTPIETEKPLLKDPDGEDVDVHIYRSMIRSLMYLTSSRPDIMFAVCACARFQVTPKVSHLHAVKRIFRYLKGKPHLGLWYPKDSSFNLVAYFDSDYARASLDRKSIIGGCQFLGQTTTGKETSNPLMADSLCDNPSNSGRDLFSKY
nr:uncharacterized mitochondrial protein AtMg00810-like [Tanacetum cinerariifolium]